jgi:hypothetical protein
VRGRGKKRERGIRCEVVRERDRERRRKVRREGGWKGERGWARGSEGVGE